MVLDPHTAKAALQLEMVRCRGVKWVQNDYVWQNSVTQILIALQWWELAQRQTYECKALPNAQDSPQPHPDRINKLCYATKKPHQPTTDRDKQDAL